MEIASNIAKGKAWKSGNVMIVPNASDRMKACDYLSKIDGAYAPQKIDNTIKGSLGVNEVTYEQAKEIQKKLDEQV